MQMIFDEAEQVTNYQKVREFHEAFGAPLDQLFTRENQKLRVARWNLIVEEYSELCDEILQDDEKYFSKSKFAKELADLLYVVYGTAATFGIDIDRVFHEVHESNMSKLGKDGKPVYRDDGKVLKGPWYKPPNLSWVK